MCLPPWTFANAASCPRSLRALAQCVDSLHAMRMASPIVISIPHRLGRAEARRRIEAGFGKIVNSLPGSSGPAGERWDGDRLTFSVAALGQAAFGAIEVFDDTVTMEIELPGVLKVIASGLRERLEKMGQLLLK